MNVILCFCFVYNFVVVLATDDVFIPSYRIDDTNASACDLYPDICSSTNENIAMFEKKLALERVETIQTLMKIPKTKESKSRVGFKFTCKLFCVVNYNLAPPYGSIINASELILTYEIYGLTLPDDGYMIFSANRRSQPDPVRIDDGYVCYNASSTRQKWCEGEVYISQLMPGTHVLSVELHQHNPNQPQFSLPFSENHVIFDIIPSDNEHAGMNVKKYNREFELTHPEPVLFPLPPIITQEISNLQEMVKMQLGRKVSYAMIGAWGYDGQKSIWRQIIAKLDYSIYSLDFITLMGAIPPETDEFYNILKEKNIPIFVSQLFLSGTCLNFFSSADEAVSHLAELIVQMLEISFRKSWALESKSLQICVKGVIDHAYFFLPEWGLDSFILLYGHFSGYDGFFFANSIQVSDGLLSAMINFLDAASVFDLPNLGAKTSLTLIDPTFFTAPSIYARRIFQIENPSISNVLTIHPGVDVTKFVYDEEQRTSVYLDQEFVIGFLGRIETEKSIGLVIHMISYMVNSTVCKISPCRFEFVGDGAIAQYLLHMASRIDVDKYISFIGGEYKNVGKKLAEFDVLINPSLRFDSETFCIVNIEAMAVGVPVISFGSSGVMDYLLDGVNGLLARNLSSPGVDLALKAEEFYHLSLEDKINMGFMGSQLIKRKFTVDYMFQKYEWLMLSTVLS